MEWINMNDHISTGFLNFAKTLKNKDTQLDTANVPPSPHQNIKSSEEETSTYCATTYMPECKIITISILMHQMRILTN
jgi:hypothetical protein